MANIFDGVHNIDEEELRYLIATLETMTIANIGNEMGQKAKKNVVKAVNVIKDIFNSKRFEEPVVVSIEERLNNKKEQLEYFDKPKLEERLKSAILVKLKSLGEIINENDSEDTISVSVINAAAKNYKKDISENLTPAQKADGIFYRYNEKLISQAKEQLNKQNKEELKKTEGEIQKQIDNMGQTQQEELKKALGIDKLTGESVRKMLSTTAGTTGAIVALNASGFGVYMGLTTIMHAIFTTTLGITLPFAAYTGATSALSFIIGPAGWLALIGAQAFMINKNKNKIIYELLSQTIWISVRSYGSNFTPKDEELPSWLPKVERDKADKDSHDFMELIKENESLKNNYEHLKYTMEANEKNIENYIEVIEKMKIEIEAAKVKSEESKKEKQVLENNYDKINKEYQLISNKLDLNSEEFKQLTEEEKNNHNKILADYKKSKDELYRKNAEIDQLYKMIEESMNEINEREKDISNLEMKSKEDSETIVSLNERVEKTQSQLSIKTDNKVKQLQSRWETVFKKFIFDTAVIKYVVKNFEHNELGNIEAVLMEMHETKDPAALSNNRGKMNDGRLHIAFSTPSGFPGRIFYIPNKQTTNKTIVIDEIVKHNDSRYGK